MMNKPDNPVSINQSGANWLREFISQRPALSRSNEKLSPNGEFEAVKGETCSIFIPFAS
ncbi:hypothetical protein [Cellvibrio polysaccharolyticus]|uniref:hypothetical protein n=1 Tax=Cellvibrio polysaccharolyticus TaxID=2082724 RepID=UPI0018818E3D|nr:hypothetical protein [Cellvibrio polysaccharolyticus]